MTLSKHEVDPTGKIIGMGLTGSTPALILVLEYDAVIRIASQALQPGGRLAVFDMKKPENWPAWLVRLAVWLNKPIGVSLELADRHSWELIRRYLNEVIFPEHYFGAH